ncbi:MAG TPA: ester cyclase [Candidatus Angelobacter sp.]|nr:ester cyclase [Candidatus Angelobacter sp.]
MLKRNFLATVCLCAILFPGAWHVNAQNAQSGKAVLEAYVSAWNRRDYAAIGTLLAPNGIHEDLAQGFRGQGTEQVQDFLREILKSEPDFVWHLTLVAQSGSVVAAEWTWTTTYTGDTQYGPVVGKRISGRGASIAVIENGRINRFTDYYDNASFFPKPPAPSVPGK